MKTKILLLLSISFILGCTEQQRGYNNVPFIREKPIIKIESVDTKEIITFPPGQMELLNDYLLLFDIDGYLAKIIYKDSAKDAGYFGEKGQGPNEYISPYFAGKDIVNQKIYVYDITLRVMREYSYYTKDDTLVTNIENQTNRMSENVRYFSIHHMSNGFYVAPLTQSDDNSKFFILQDKDLNTIKQFGDFPLPIDLENKIRLGGIISSFGNQFIFVGMNYAYIGSYKVNDNGETEKQWEYYISEPSYEYKNGEFRWKEDNIEGFFDIKATSKYVFALQKGRNMGDENYLPNHIWVFDFAGNLMEIFELDRYCVRMDVTEDNKVYAFSVSNDSEIVTYDLNSYL